MFFLKLQKYANFVKETANLKIFFKKKKTVAVPLNGAATRMCLINRC